jgi:type 1 fimbriae regulatory protein FimB
LKLKRDGFSESTLKGFSKWLRLLSVNCDIDNPEAVKNFIANLNRTTDYKRNLVASYDHFAKYNQIKWERPKYKKTGNLKKVPLEQNVNFIIEHAHSLKRKVVFTLIKEYGLRPVEISKLTLRDIDLEQGLLYVKTAKYGNPRDFKIKPDTLAMLILLVGQARGDLDKRIFASPDTLNQHWRVERRRAFIATGNPEFLKIRLYDLRHYFATMLYCRTKDLLFVMQQLGHKNIQNTMVYTHLVNFRSEEFHVSVAKTVDDACKLIEQGFEYVTEIEGIKLFRKRK